MQKILLTSIAIIMAVTINASVAQATGPRECDLDGACDPYQPDPEMVTPPAQSTSPARVQVAARVAPRQAQQVPAQPAAAQESATQSTSPAETPPATTPAATPAVLVSSAHAEPAPLSPWSGLIPLAAAAAYGIRRTATKQA